MGRSDNGGATNSVKQKDMKYVFLGLAVMDATIRRRLIIPRLSPFARQVPRDRHLLRCPLRNKMLMMRREFVVWFVKEVVETKLFS